MDLQLLSEEQRQKLSAYLEGAAPGRLRTRAHILLLYDSGNPTREVARQCGYSRSRVRFWRGEFLKQGLVIIRDLEHTAGLVEPQFILAPDEEHQVAPPEEPGATAPLSAEPLMSQEIKTRFWDPRIDIFMEQGSLYQSPGVLPDDPLSEAGRKVWRYHLYQMLVNEAGTRSGEDIEALHDMRVATRRMRAAFEVFDTAFEPKALKPHLKGLRLTGRALGSVRDLDVFIEKAHAYLDGVTDEYRPGFTPLMLAWQEKRQLARGQMQEFLDSARYRKFVLRFLDFLETPFAGARKPVVEQPQPNLVREIAPALIYSRLAAVRAFDAVLPQATLVQFHALRIEFKKLRYTVEYFREVLGPEARMVISEIKDLQDHLGDLNDAQVASQILKDFLHEWDERQASLPVQERLSPEPVLRYLSYRYQERQQLMLTFHERWSHFNSPELHQNLALAISVL